MSQLHPDLEAQVELIAARVSELLTTGRPPVIPKWLTPDEASLFINMPEKTLRHWRAKGVGPTYSRLGRHVRYDVDKLLEWMRGQEVER